MGKKDARKLAKQQEAEKKRQEKDARMKNPKGGSRYAAKGRKIEKGEKLPFGISDKIEEQDNQEQGADYWDRMFGHSFDAAPKQTDDRPDWEIAREQTGDKASRFNPPKTQNPSKQEIDEGLFQTQAYFIHNKKVTSLRIGFGERVNISPADITNDEFRATSLVARKTGEAANMGKIWSHQPDTIPTWEIKRHTGLGVKDANGKDKGEIVVAEVLATKRDIRSMLTDWCKTYGSQSATQDTWPQAQFVSRFDR